jgi:hypothetical protein
MPVRKLPASGERKLELQTVKKFASLEEIHDLHMKIYKATEDVDDLIVTVTTLIQTLEQQEE